VSGKRSSTQAQIFGLIKKMKENETSLLLITHDMGAVWEMCDRVVVMYASKIVETGSLADIFEHPAHPYTIGLLSAIPRLSAGRRRLTDIAGQVPSPFDYPEGCNYQARCPHVFERCRQEVPPLFDCGNNQYAACFLKDPTGLRSDADAT